MRAAARRSRPTGSAPAAITRRRPRHRHRCPRPRPRHRRAPRLPSSRCAGGMGAAPCGPQPAAAPASAAAPAAPTKARALLLERLRGVGRVDGGAQRDALGPVGEAECREGLVDGAERGRDGSEQQRACVAAQRALQQPRQQRVPVRHVRAVGLSERGDARGQRREVSERSPLTRSEPARSTRLRRARSTGADASVDDCSSSSCSTPCERDERAFMSVDRTVRCRSARRTSRIAPSAEWTGTSVSPRTKMSPQVSKALVVDLEERGAHREARPAAGGAVEDVAQRARRHAVQRIVWHVVSICAGRRRRLLVVRQQPAEERVRLASARLTVGQDRAVDAR
eukprot:scaffold44858_cov63-Phaeocystis_antarctica.AAC.1